MTKQLGTEILRAGHSTVLPSSSPRLSIGNQKHRSARNGELTSLAARRKTRAQCARILIIHARERTHTQTHEIDTSNGVNASARLVSAASAAALKQLSTPRIYQIVHTLDNGDMPVWYVFYTFYDCVFVSLSFSSFRRTVNDTYARASSRRDRGIHKNPRRCVCFQPTNQPATRPSVEHNSATAAMMWFGVWLSFTETRTTSHNVTARQQHHHNRHHHARNIISSWAVDATQ